GPGANRLAGAVIDWFATAGTVVPICVAGADPNTDGTAGPVVAVGLARPAIGRRFFAIKFCARRCQLRQLVSRFRSSHALSARSHANFDRRMSFIKMI